MSRNHIWPTALGIMIVLAVAQFGCGSAPTPPKQGVRKVQGLVTLYFNAAREQGRPPANEAEFKQYVQEHGKPVIERLGLTSVDELFVSSRDGKPYVIVFGKSPSGVVVHEADGVDGVREVGFQTGQVKEVTEEEFTPLGL